MKTIAFYISDHGFGHASRNIPIIKSILEQDSEVFIIVKTGSNQLNFIKQTLKDYLSRVALYQIATDVGLVLKEGTLELDIDKLKEETEKFVFGWGQRIQEEEKFLLEKKVEVVISDIVPWIFRATHNLSIKSIFISNFSWCEIYKEYLPESIWGEYLNCYKSADRAFLYGLYNEELENYFIKFLKVGLSCRDFDLKKVQSIKNRFKSPIVYLSVGRSVGLKAEMNVDGIPYDFIVTEGVNIKGCNVYYLPIDTDNTHDYIKASTFVVTKAGWGTVAEALCAAKPMAIISRDSIAEDRNTTEKVVESGLGLKINFNELMNIDLVLKRLEQIRMNKKRHELSNESSNIAKLILADMRSEENGQE